MRKILPRRLTGATDAAVQDYETAHGALARRAAAEGIVLLKNEGDLLPLPAGARLALYGRGASRTVKGGTGSGEVNNRRSVSIYEGLKAAGYRIVNEDEIVSYDRRYDEAREAWYRLLREKRETCRDGMEFFEKVYCSTPFVCPEEMQATEHPADAAIYVLSRSAGEGRDRDPGKGDYLLSEDEEAALSGICRLYGRVAVILNVGGPVDLSFLDRYPTIQGLILLSQAGQEGGHALADVLSGRVNPSGRLTDSWACRYADYPCADRFSRLGDALRQEYAEGLYVGYRWFDSFGIPVRYGFGFGLSYTGFSMQATDMRYGDGHIHVDVRVKNTGPVSGRQVVQLYVSCPRGRLRKEYRRLAAFAKTGLLAPGESRTVSLDIPLDRLASYDEALPGWVLERGGYVFWLGDGLESSAPFGRAVLAEETVLEITENLCSPRETIRELRPERDKAVPPFEGFLVEIPAGSVSTRRVRYGGEDVRGDQAEEIADSLSTEQLIALVCGDPDKSQSAARPSQEIYVPGAAAETSSRAVEKGVASITLADGPAGLRLSQYYDVENGKILPRGLLASLEGGALCPDEGVRGRRRWQYCTAFPVGTLLAQSWDSELQKAVGAAVGEEMGLFGVTLWLAPGMNIHRNPLCGRNFEYFSEDPLLSGLTAAAITEGVQSVPGCGVTVKHFAANNAEDQRMRSDSIVSERTLREIYFKGFETAVKAAAPMAIMTSYNKINGVHAANCGELCTALARDEWGFQGVIMTDWGTTLQGPDCTAGGCILAGNDLIMPGDRRDLDALAAAVESGALPLSKLRISAARVIRTVLQSARYE